MTIFLLIIHVVVCIALILIVLLQTGKGADMGSAFGGGSSQTLLGSTGASTLLSKATTIVAIVFMLTSIGLAYVSGHKKGHSIMVDSKIPIEAPLTKETPVAEGKPIPEEPANSAPTVPVDE
ncbi:MAG TPA: preprotein translocase subunit SecG [Desulfobacteraceae bacterium]|nr:preprotein translocase subunit SecG [Desulfobacteraceae bacterium]